MPHVERRRDPQNLEGNKYLHVPMESLDVAEFHPEPDGKGSPTEVHLSFRIEGLEDMPLVVRFQSHNTISQLDRGPDRSPE